jgi:lysyl-tRNA synthetase class II
VIGREMAKQTEESCKETHQIMNTIRAYMRTDKFIENET